MKVSSVYFSISKHIDAFLWEQSALLKNQAFIANSIRYSNNNIKCNGKYAFVRVLHSQEIVSSAFSFFSFISTAVSAYIIVRLYRNHKQACMQQCLSLADTLCFATENSGCLLLQDFAFYSAQSMHENSSSVCTFLGIKQKSNAKRLCFDTCLDRGADDMLLMAVQKSASAASHQSVDLLRLIEQKCVCCFSLKLIQQKIEMQAKRRSNIMFHKNAKKYFILLLYVLTLHCGTWLGSCIFHIKDCYCTQCIDYFGAMLSILLNLVLSLERLSIPSRTAKIAFSVFLVAHILYMHFICFNYSYNSAICGVLFGLNVGLWMLWYICIRKKAYSRMLMLSVIGVVIAAFFQVIDFGPVYFLLDSHALWHILGWIFITAFYLFIVIDFQIILQKSRPKSILNQLLENGKSHLCVFSR